MSTILVIDDDASIVRGLEEALTGEHYKVLSSLTGQKGLQLARSRKPDLIILDLRLPDRNGEEICQELRSTGMTTPIIILSSKGDEVDKIVGLETGADDYVTKPFSVRELLARIKAHLRRTDGRLKEQEHFAFGDISVDFRTRMVRRGKKPVKLTSREFAVLQFFIEHEGEVVTRDMLLDTVWGYDQYPVTRTVDNYVLSLRKKIEPDPAHPSYILTVPTSGYRFVPTPA
ncbi:MAG TPA: response regulator transcription factor [Bacteroidota bacterium]